MANETITNETVKAAKQIRSLLATRLKTESGVHAGTVVAAAARLAGTTLMRTFQLPLQGLEPGTAVLSDRANSEWPKLMGLVLSLLKANGIEFQENEMVVQTPKEHLPHETLVQTQSRFQSEYDRIVREQGLDSLHAAYAGAVACAMAISELRHVLNPRIACGIAAYAFIESTKTVPPPAG